MDTKCVRVLRLYDEVKTEKNVIYIDEDAKYSLRKEWGETIHVRGRKMVHNVQIQPLKPMDQEGFIARMGQELLDNVFVEYGEEVMLERE